MLRFISFLAASLVLFFAHAQVPEYVPTNGLVGYWDFQGNANDKSGNGLNGIVNGPTLCPDRYGNMNHAYSFDGINDYIQVLDNNLLDLTSAFTISLWFYAPSFTGTPVLVSKSGGIDGYQLDFENQTASSSILRLSPQLYESTRSYYFNYWSQLTVTYDLKNVKIYSRVSDLRMDSIANTKGTVVPNTLNLLLGTRASSSSDYYKGILDDIGIWNRVLTKAEIEKLGNGVPKAVGDPKVLNT